ncbi:MAG: 2Fe-2S iron-sulfur cluster binding domain-containing protein [Venatoribacter sp.]
MFSFFKKKTTHQARINDAVIEVNSKETILNSALRQGIAMAHSCRVGGCGTCKCQLLEGEIKALTDFGYILNEEELNNNVILACQSVPKSNVKIRATVASSAAQVQEVQGRVIEQEQLTHDIVRLRLRMDSSLTYQAGQYAELAVASLAGEFRNFSFASPSYTHGQLEFFIRAVPGGLFTQHVLQNSLLEQQVTVRGPYGDFYLRQGNEPLLFIAGGSGLAPIKAILESGLEQGIQRDAVLLFGARQQRDLYLLEELQELSTKWQGQFRFLPVLSEEPESSNWQGLRGLVTEHIQPHFIPAMHAYLCGPPAMIDAACSTLATLGVNPENIHADRFLTNNNKREIA